MIASKQKGTWMLSLLIAGVLASVPAFAGSGMVGSVAGSMNATIEGQPLPANTVIFSGQSLSVGGGAAVVATTSGARIVFGRDTKASFSRNEDEVGVQLAQGSASIFAPNAKAKVRLNASGISVVPTGDFKTLCEVAMVGDSILVTSKQGTVKVEGAGAPVEVPQGKSITINRRTARAPQASGGGLGGGSAVAWAAVAAGGTAAILAGISLSRAGDARDNALAAESAANAANSTAATAASNAATAASNAATAASNAAAAETQAITVGCSLNALANAMMMASVYVPPTGTTCAAP